MKYRKSITAKKGLKEFAYALGASGAVATAMEVVRDRWGLPWGQEQDVRIAVAVFAALVGGLKSLRNWIKERRKRKRERQRQENLNRFPG